MSTFLKYRVLIFIGILVIFHTVGIVLITTQPNGAQLSYVNLILCGIIVFLSEKKRQKTFSVLLIITIGGFLIEYIGTSTGLLFGNYSYGASLGLKLFSVPIIIGLNWYIIVTSSANIANLLTSSSTIFRAIIAGVLCTGMDYLIEPVAIKYDFWQWEEEVIPIYNYLCWFFFCVIFAYLYLKISKGINHPSIILYGLWIVFFTILNFA